jgi:hypothetical protein
MQLADEALATEALEHPLASDPWFNPVGRLHGRADFDGYEYIESQVVLDHLQIPMAARRASLFRRLIALMRAHDWEPIRIKRNGIDGGGVTERIRGYRRKTNKLPHPQVSKDFQGKIDASTPYIIGKVVSRLETDSRWALARSVRAVVAERDTLKEKLGSRQCATSDVAPGPDIGRTGQNRRH